MRRLMHHRPSPAMVVAVIALFVALGGAAYAATQINGALIKKNSEPGNRINKKTFVAKAKFASRASNATNADHASQAGSASPSGAAGGALSGSYPNPSVANGAITSADLALGARTGTLKSGETITGFLIVQGTATGSGFGFVNGAGFQLLPQSAIPPENFQLITGASGPHCPGVGQADAGYLCVYQTYATNVSAAHVFAEDGHQLDATRTGFGVQAIAAAAGDVEFGGSWAYTQA
jgi:hypothetical protein